MSYRFKGYLIQTVRKSEKKTGRFTDTRTEGETDRYTDTQVDRQTDRQTDKRRYVQTNENIHTITHITSLHIHNHNHTIKEKQS